MSVVLEADHFAARGGLALRRRRWSGPHAKPRGTFAIVHGLAEHSARYDHVARSLVERGWRVHAFDQRGHGESEGARNYAPRFELGLDDIERFLLLVRREEGDRPLVLLGHSMGGLQVAVLLAERRPQVTAAVLSGPALSVGGSSTRLALVRLLSALAPRLRLGRAFEASGLSRDAEVVRAYEADPLISTRVTMRLVGELLRYAARAPAYAPKIAVPLLVAHGEADPLCDVDGSRAFCASLPPGRGELITYPGLRHEILNEPEWPQVLGDICDWIDKQLPLEATS